MKEGLDLAGLGKLAKAIPKEVYTKTTDTLLTSFKKLVAPITETSDGLGRYIHQKFDSMVKEEKALATYTLRQACTRAKAKAASLGVVTVPPAHPKSFVKALEEASKETDPLLHELWANLLASQLLDGYCHPHFVELLPHFSPAEARLLLSLRDWNTVGEHGGKVVMFNIDRCSHWIAHVDDTEAKPWTISCTFLIEFGLADLLAWRDHKRGDPPILYRTFSGTEFLKAVSI
jgi:hypothetical protein